MQLTAINSSARWQSAPAGNATGIVIVDPDPLALEARSAYLATCSWAVLTARTPFELFELQIDLPPRLAILSDALGAQHLLALAEYVRHRWPQTRILVIGHAAEMLEDHLYDDAVAGDCSLPKLAAALHVCCQRAS